jgi:hypothetical protein
MLGVMTTIAICFISILMYCTKLNCNTTENEQSQTQPNDATTPLLRTA